MNPSRWPPAVSRKLQELATLTSATTSYAEYDWASIEARLGFSFPTEFKAYAQTFPPGLYLYLLHVLHPAMPGGNGLEEHLPTLAHMFQGWAETNEFLVEKGFMPASVYRFYPEPGGLIPWATFNSLAALCWLPEGEDPDRWPVVAYRDNARHQRIVGGTLDALMRVLRGEAGHGVFPDQMFDEPIEFEPWDPRDYGLEPGSS